MNVKQYISYRAGGDVVQKDVSSYENSHKN